MNTRRTPIRKPQRRACEQCGRIETWDRGDETWVISEEDGNPCIGNPHCIHEWDINGTFSPVN